MKLEELETLRRMIGQKKAKASSSIPKNVRFSEPEAREVPSKLAPALTEIILETTTVLSLPASFAIGTQPPSLSIAIEATSEGLLDFKSFLRESQGGVTP